MGGGAYGNHNLLFVKRCQYLAVTSAADEGLALARDTEAVTLYCTEDAWVVFGTDPTAAGPGAEKTKTDSFFLPATTVKDVPVPLGTDSAPIKVSAIRNTADGTLYIEERSAA
jgi:hypothetical protein